jgi:hypothetical protein
MYVNLEGIIPFGAGLWATLIAFGVTSMPTALQRKPWRDTWMRFAKIGGPLLMVFGIVLMFVRL